MSENKVTFKRIHNLWYSILLPLAETEQFAFYQINKTKGLCTRLSSTINPKIVFRWSLYLNSCIVPRGSIVDRSKVPYAGSDTWGCWATHWTSPPFFLSSRLRVWYRCVLYIPSSFSTALECSGRTSPFWVHRTDMLWGKNPAMSQERVSREVWVPEETLAKVTFGSTGKGMKRFQFKSFSILGVHY